MVTEKKKEWYIYILLCCDGSFYTGVTNDIDKRMDAHATGRGSKYVNSRGFKELLRVKLCQSHSDACKAEAYVKRLPKNEKLGWFD